MNRTASPLLATIMASLTVCAASSAGGNTGGKNGSEPVVILTKVKEIRQTELVKPLENEFSMDNPGLELSFSKKGSERTSPSGNHPA